MNNKKIKILKAFLIINIILILLLFLGAFYGKNILRYGNETINGVDNKINFFELINVMYFADEEDYSKVSKAILKQDKATYDNYMLTTKIEIGVPAIIEDYSVRDSKTTMNIRTKIDGNASVGIIDVESNGKTVRYNYYRELKNGKITTYLNVDGNWYKKEESVNDGLGIKHIIDALHETNYKQFPTLTMQGITKSDLYPADSNVRKVTLCQCGSVSKILTYSVVSGEIRNLIENTTSIKYDESARMIEYWMAASDYRLAVEYEIEDIGQTSVSVPEEVKNQAVDGEIHDVIIEQLVDMTQTKL